MRTNIELDQASVHETMGYVAVKSKRELVDLAPREFVAARRRRDVSELFGKEQIDPDDDDKRSRRSDFNHEVTDAQGTA